MPGSKTVLIALAWGVVTGVLPSLGVSGRVTGATWVVFGVATLLVFVRTAFFDILDVQGDRIVGKETLPILLGEETTQRLLYLGLALAAVVLVVAAATGTIDLFGLVMVVCPILMGLLISAHARGKIHPGVGLEFQLESLFVLSGLLALGWALVR